MSQSQHVANPKGVEGKRVLDKMNTGVHAELSRWGLSFLTLTDYKNILDIGCGGGANVAYLLKNCPDAHVSGVDYSELSVSTSEKLNAEAVKAGRCTIQLGNVRELPFSDEIFDLATAFETIYFWPDITDSFAQASRVLKDGGVFFICNETDGDDPEGYEWEKNIEGLKIYKESEICDYLKQAGFTDVSVKRDPKRHWICFLAEKSVIS